MTRLALRCLYATLGVRLTVKSAAIGARLIGRAASEPFVDGLLSALERRFVRSGWPHRPHHWINLHTSRFAARLRTGWRRAPQPRPHRCPTMRERIKVGVIGRFSGLLGFPEVLFRDVPPEIELVVFDQPYDGRRADYLRLPHVAYEPIELDDDDRIRDARERIAAHGLDVLLNTNAKADGQRLLDAVDTCCVMHYSAGSDLLHHPRVDVELVWQMQPGYTLEGGQFRCHDSGLRVPSAMIRQIDGFYDTRGLVPNHRPWSARRNVIVSHGSLYKFAQPLFLSCVLDVLEQCPDAQWMVAGRDDGQSLAAIRKAAGHRQLSARVDYLGHYSSAKNEAGEVSDAGWLKLVELLGHARLVPDPFPMSSGSSRFESYLLGVPSVHMQMDATAGTTPLVACDLPILRVPDAEAATPADYVALSVRCLRDGLFADRVQAMQHEVAMRSLDVGRWWQHIIAAYRGWAAQRGTQP